MFFSQQSLDHVEGMVALFLLLFIIGIYIYHICKCSVVWIIFH